MEQKETTIMIIIMKPNASEEAVQKVTALIESRGLTLSLIHIYKLLSMSYFHKSMEELLYTITFGQDCDIQFSGQLSRPSDAVTLMTLHASKGLEFPMVFLYCMKKGLIPLNP